MRPVNIGKRIRARRIAAGLTQVELSKKSGVTQNHISAIETGKKKAITIVTLRKLARALGCKIGDLAD